MVEGFNDDITQISNSNKVKMVGEGLKHRLNIKEYSKFIREAQKYTQINQRSYKDYFKI